MQIDRRLRDRLRAARPLVVLFALLLGPANSHGEAGSPLSDASPDARGATVAVPGSAPAAGRWELRATLSGRGELPSALAISPTGSFAVGDSGGVSWWRGISHERAALPAVRDLVFDAEGQLWIGTESGLYRWSEDARPVLRDLRGGEAANRIRRIALEQRSLVLATEGGAFWSTRGRIFQALQTTAQGEAGSLVALRRADRIPGRRADPLLAPEPIDPGASARDAVQARVWFVGDLGLLRLRGLESPSGLRVLARERLRSPRPLREIGAVDLVVDAAVDRLYMVYADAIAWTALDASPGAATGTQWSWLRPVLPPGARIQRMQIARGSVLLATDHGLLEAARPDAAYRRVAGPAGTSVCFDVRARGVANAAAVRLMALCREGVFEWAPVLQDASRPAHRSAQTARMLPPVPPLAEIRRRALERSGLAASRSAALWRGLRRRAYWPSLDLRLGVDGDRDRSRDADESFVSGQTRHLLDRGRDEGFGWEAAIALDWDLGGLVYPEDAVDLSRELRQVVSLRDDVVDEINQLYFERQRLRARLLRAEELSPAEQADALWRAREIDAGLDAWSGGWVSRWRGARTDAGPGPDHPTEQTTREGN